MRTYDVNSKQLKFKSERSRPLRSIIDSEVCLAIDLNVKDFGIQKFGRAISSKLEKKRYKFLNVVDI